MAALVADGLGWLLTRNEAHLDRLRPKSNGPLDPAMFSWTRPLAERWPEMRAEIDQLWADNVRLPSTAAIAGFDQGNTGTWNSFVLCSYGQWNDANSARCPVTRALVQDVPGLQIAGFSVFGPGTHLPRHRGPNRGALRYQIGLKVPEPAGSCRIKVGDSMHTWAEGGELLFDHSVPHEAWNDASGDRVLLFLELVWPFPGLAGVMNRAMQRVFSLGARGLPQRVDELSQALNP